MLYESYERKILKIVRIKNSIIRHRVPIIIFASLILAMLSVFLFFKGSITKDLGEIKNITYGENIDVSYFVFCGKGYLEYKTEDGEWTTEKPIYPGNYSVRLVSSRTFGIKSSGKIHTFTIDKKEITTALGSAQIVYGENANLTGSLCYGDKISSFGAVFESSEVGSTSLKIDKDSIKAVDSNGNDVSFVYNFSGIDTTVSIIKRKITITTSDISKVYDGTNEITAECETTSGGYSLVDGHKIEAECKLTSNSVGTCKTQITSYKIINADGTDVTDNYSITTKFGNATITQRPITIYPQNVSKIYDGTRLSTSTGLIHGESVNKLVDGHSISVECESNDENVGTHENTITDYTITDGSSNDVTKNYSVTTKNGTITVSKRAIIIYPQDTSKIYDGTNSIETEGLTKDGTKLAVGHTLEIECELDGIDVGMHTSAITKYTITDANKKDATANYNVKMEDGTSIIKQRPITIKPKDTTKVYDGTNEITAEYETTSGGYFLVEGHKIVATCKLTSVDAGDSNTEITSCEIYTAENVKVTDNYAISTQQGSATITPRPITIYPQDVSKIYDGTKLSTSVGLIQTDSEYDLVNGHTISVECESNTADIDASVNIVTKYTITDASGKEVTKNYSATPKTGTITITKRAITIYPETTEKIYDGTNSIETKGLTKDGTKLADGHTLEIVCELSGVNVGTHINTINSYTIKDADKNDVTGNYEVKTETGPATINKRPITVKPTATFKVYDGTNEITAEYETTSDGYSLVDGHKIVATCKLTSVDAGDSNTEITSCEIYTVENIKVTDNYEITLQQGSATITQRPIIIYPQEVTKEYDGTHLSKSTGLIQTGTEYGLVLDHTISVECESNTADITASKNTITSYTITDGNSNDVTKNYSVTTKIGKIEIEQRSITVKAKDTSKVYDGTPLTSIDYEITLGSLVDGQTIEITTDGSVTDVDETKITNNNITAVKITSGNDDVTKNYDITTESGTLKITPREITIVADSATKVYDKFPLTCDTYTVENLVSGHELDKTCVKIDGTITRAGETENIVTIDNDKFVVTDQNGTVKTHNYTYATQYGKLTVTPRPLTVRLSGITKVYSGKAVDLTNISYWLPKQDANSGLAGDDKIQSVTNIYAIDSNNKKTSVINVGTYKTTGTVTIIDAKGDDFTDCYDINCYGAITITEFIMQCTVDNTENETFTFSELRFFRSAEMPAGHKISCDTEETLSITELLKHIKVTDTNGTDVTSNYKFEYEKTQT